MRNPKYQSYKQRQSQSKAFYDKRICIMILCFMYVKWEMNDEYKRWFINNIHVHTTSLGSNNTTQNTNNFNSYNHYHDWF